jgi:NifU-like protein involved in Fe-S cluster formation
MKNLFIKTNHQFVRYIYNNKVIKLLNNPPNMGTLNKNDICVGSALVGSATSGDVMSLQIKINPKTKIIIDSKFKTFGCGSSIASSAFATENIIGKTLDQAMILSDRHISDYLELPPIKMHCSMLSRNAIASAILDVKSKNKFKNISNDVCANLW